MSIGTDTAEEEVNTTDVTDFLFITCTLGCEVSCITVQDIDVLLADVNMAEEVIPHEAMITLRVFFGQVNVLVHIKSHYITERHFTRFVEFDQSFVHTEGRRAGRETENERFALLGIKLVDTFCHIIRSPLAKQVIRRFNNYTHLYFKFKISNLGFISHSIKRMISRSDSSGLTAMI